MPKDKNKSFTADTDNSDDYDSSCSGLRVKEKINKIFITASDSSRKSKSKLSNTKRKQTKDEEKKDDTSTESEIEYKGRLMSSKYLFENVSSEKNKKRKREEVSSDSDLSEQRSVSSSQIKNIGKHVSNSPRKKVKRKEKDKIDDSYKSLETLYASENITKQKNIKSEQGNSSDSSSSDHNIRHVSLLDIKRELLSDNGELEAEAEIEDTNNNSASVNTLLNISEIKSEQQSQCSSDSEDEAQVSTTTSSHRRPTLENSSVTILQDIRFMPKLSVSSWKVNINKVRPAKVKDSDTCFASNSQTMHERLKAYFGDLQQKEITAVFDLSDSEEVSILRVPRNADLKLKKMEIDPENRCKINLGEKYVMTPSTNLPDPNYVVSTNSRVIKLKSNIKMEKYIKSKSEPNILVPEKKLVPLPENLKKRHPLFGSDFQQKIRLSDRVEKKLDDAIANLLKREKRAKKKKNKKEKHEDKEEDVNNDQEIFNLLNSHSFLTNHDRIKKETSDDSAFGSSSSIDRLKGKKNRQVKQEMQVYADSNLNEQTVKSSKKKKSKSPHRQKWPDVSNIKNEVQDTDTVDHNESLSLSKGDRKKLSIINSTLMADILKTPQFDPGVSSIALDASPPRKKLKKSKKERKPNDEVKVKKEKLISELLNDITTEMKVPKIKKET